MLYVVALLAAIVALASPSPAPEPTPTLTPTQTLAKIRNVFRSHRPPPPYETYTISRKQDRNDGYPDVTNTYTYHVWVRNSDRAAMKRRVFRDNYEYPPEFDRPAFNEARDPGPPTADIFEAKSFRPHPVEEPYTPEPSATEVPIIGRITTVSEYDYRVTSMTIEGPEIHLMLEPIRDPNRNRLRELYADKNTYELHRFVATDTLYVQGDRDYGTLFTTTMGVVDGVPVVTDIHGIVGDNYQGDGQVVDFTFRDIRFPPTLPDWYFNSREYGGHTSDVPL